VSESECRTFVSGESVRNSLRNFRNPPEMPLDNPREGTRKNTLD
jgi:hypothetical protein